MDGKSQKHKYLWKENEDNNAIERPIFIFYIYIFTILKWNLNNSIWIWNRINNIIIKVKQMIFVRIPCRMEEVWNLQGTCLVCQLLQSVTYDQLPLLIRWRYVFFVHYSTPQRCWSRVKSYKKYFECYIYNISNSRSF